MKNLFTAIKAFFRSLTANAPVTQAPTSCGNINALLLHLCDFDHALHMWVLRWLAFPLQNPGLVSIPLGFLAGWLGTVTSAEPPDEARHAETEVRSLTGAGAV